MIVEQDSLAPALGGVLIDGTFVPLDFEQIDATAEADIAAGREASLDMVMRQMDVLIAGWERKRRLNLEESQRVERLTRVIATTFMVWNDRDVARHFLTTPHALLETRAPIEVASTDLGARRVEDLLWGLAHGLPV